MSRATLVTLAVLVAVAVGVGPTLAAKPEVPLVEQSWELDLGPLCGTEVLVEETGVVKIITTPTRSLEVTSLTAVFTNLENETSLQLRYGTGLTTTTNETLADGSLLTILTFSGLNVLYDGGSPVTTFAGRGEATFLTRFDKQGKLVSVAFVGETETPHLEHLFPFLCEHLA